MHKQLMTGGIQLVRLDYPVTNQRYKNRPDIYGDAQKLPVMNASIDAVLLLEVLEHIESDSAVLSEANRVLKVGGVLYISVPFIYPQHDVPYDFRRWTQYGLRQVLETNGFVIRELRVHGHSLITAMQLFNLALLEICQELLKWNRVVGLLAVCLCYPLCLVINLLALPLSLIRLPHAASFGFFVIAERAEGH